MKLRFLTAGESHGPALIAILEGMPAGLQISEQAINNELARRQKGYGSGPRMKIENDRCKILAGVMEGHTIGAPVALSIENIDHSKWKGKYIKPYTTPRPGHVDLAGVIKYGYDDIRPALERSSARETAARVAVGSICRQFLANFDIVIGGYVVSIGPIEAQFSTIPFLERFQKAEQNDVRCPDEAAVDAMRQLIRDIIGQRDTLGGILEIVALGLPVGLGSHVHWDLRLEARLGSALLSVPAIKGVEIGPAFHNAHLPGTQVHDSIHLTEDRITRPTNRSGGTEGGISTGQPLVLRAAMKPIATTLTPQQTVDLATGEEKLSKYERSDFCPVPRAVPVLEAMVAYVLADAMLEKLGGDSMGEIIERYSNLRMARLSDLKISVEDHLYWPDEPAEAEL